MAGIVLLVMGLGFIAWARLRPVKVPEHVEPVDDDPTRPAPQEEAAALALTSRGGARGARIGSRHG